MCFKLKLFKTSYTKILSNGFFLFIYLLFPPNKELLKPQNT